MKPIISIQGVKASFHDIAANQFFGQDTGRVFCDTFADTVTTLQDRRSDYALCAIENSLYGSINEVYDLILGHRLHMFGEVYLRIEQCLIGLPGTKIDDIRHVYSHPVALAQCEEYLDTVLPSAERMEHHDTAASVEYIVGLGDVTAAAIASRQAAELHKLPILASSIETNKANYTRFIALSRDASDQPSDPDKTSLVVRTDHTPGALYKALGAFAERSINLTKIQSRPIIGKAWHYIFYIDIECGIDKSACQDAIDDLRQQGCTITVLGSYRKATP